jgi:hypothetical protein
MAVDWYRLIVLAWAAIFVALAWLGPERACEPTQAAVTGWGTWAAVLAAAFALRYRHEGRSMSATAHLSPLERATVRSLWAIGAFALVFVAVTDAQAGVVPCPRSLTRDVALWAAMAALMVGLFIAGEPRRRA